MAKKKPLPPLDQVMADIRILPTVPVWPHLAMALGVDRKSAYAAAERGDIEVIRIGRTIRVPTQPLRKQLGL